MKPKQILMLVSLIGVSVSSVILMSLSTQQNTAPEVASATEYDNCCYDPGWYGPRGGGCGNANQPTWGDGWSACINRQCACNSGAGAAPNPGTPVTTTGGGTTGSTTTAKKTAGQACKPLECQVALTCVTCGAGTKKSGQSVCSPALQGTGYENVCGGTVKNEISSGTSSVSADACGVGSHSACTTKNSGDEGVSGVCNCWHASAGKACSCIGLGDRLDGTSCSADTNCKSGNCENKVCITKNSTVSDTTSSAAQIKPEVVFSTSGLGLSGKELGAKTTIGVGNKSGFCNVSKDCAEGYVCALNVTDRVFRGCQLPATTANKRVNSRSNTRFVTAHTQNVKKQKGDVALTCEISCQGVEGVSKLFPGDSCIGSNSNKISTYEYTCQADGTLTANIKLTEGTELLYVVDNMKAQIVDLRTRLSSPSRLDCLSFLLAESRLNQGIIVFPNSLQSRKFFDAGQAYIVGYRAISAACTDSVIANPSAVADVSGEEYQSALYIYRGALSRLEKVLNDISQWL